MKKNTKTSCCIAVLAAMLGAPALAGAVLPAGTLITAGGATPLLGLDHLYADEAGTHVTALAADDLEYISADYAVAIDFSTDGLVRFWNNSGGSALPGTYSFTFEFDAASPGIGSFALLDLGDVNAGTITTQLLGPHSVGITFSDIGTGEFGSFTALIGSAGTVPEPASFGLVGLGLLLAAAVRRRSRA